jgi:ribonuclease HI
MITVYTDGSCKGNPGPGGWAAIIIKNNEKKIIKGRDTNSTNNRMEMTAIIEALRYIHENHLQREDIKLFSDSNLIVQTLKQGWKRKANLDLWEELDELDEELNVDFNWVKAHDTSRLNNECDRIANEEAERAKKNRAKPGLSL